MLPNSNTAQAYNQIKQCSVTNAEIYYGPLAQKCKWLSPAVKPWTSNSQIKNVVYINKTRKTMKMTVSTAVSELVKSLTSIV